MPIEIEELERLISKDKLIVGEEAVKLSGMQDGLLKEIALQNQYFGSMTVFRVNDQRNLPPFNSPGSPKPAYIHSKTSNFVGGYIPIDPIFTRSGLDGISIGHHYLDDLDSQEHIQVKWTLWEILKRCDADGDLHIQWPIEGHAIVRFFFKAGKGPTGFTGQFQIDLGEERNQFSMDITQARVITREADNPRKYLDLIPETVKLAFLPNELDIISLPYKVFYNKEFNGSFEPLMVFAHDNKPIISDWDKILDCLPLNAGIDNLIAANKEYNTMLSLENSSAVNQQKELLEETKKLFINLIYKDNMFNQEFNQIFKLKLDCCLSEIKNNIEKLFNNIAIKSNLFHMAGIITPYEFLRNILINFVHNANNAAKGIQDYYYNPCQHGVEARSPYRTDSMIYTKPTAMFHVLGINKTTVEFIYTTNNAQRINLYLLPGFLENNFVYISPCEDMAIWHPVVARQLKLYLIDLISTDTLASYERYLRTRDIPGVIPHMLPYCNQNFDNSINNIERSTSLPTATVTTTRPFYSRWKSKVARIFSKIGSYMPFYACSRTDNVVSASQPELSMERTEEPGHFDPYESRQTQSFSINPLINPEDIATSSNMFGPHYSKNSSIVHAGCPSILSPRLGFTRNFPDNYNINGNLDNDLNDIPNYNNSTDNDPLDINTNIAGQYGKNSSKMGSLRDNL